LASRVTGKLHGTKSTIEVESVELAGHKTFLLLASKPNKKRMTLKLIPCMRS